MAAISDKLATASSGVYDDNRYAALHRQTVCDKTNRLTTFVAAPESAIFTDTVSPILSCTGSGALAGAMIGSPGGPKGAGIGAAVGASVGFITGCVISVKETRASYNHWLNQARSNASFGEDFIGAYRQEAYRERFICPITQEPLVDPVITPNGRVYEREAIEEWVTNHGTDPFTRAPLTLENLREDHTTLGKHCVELKKMLDLRAEEGGLNPFARQGLEKLRDHLKKRAVEIFNREARILDEMLVADRIDENDFLRQMQIISGALSGKIEEQ